MVNTLPSKGSLAVQQTRLTNTLAPFYSKTAAEPRLTVIGAGAWGSALATVATRNNHAVKLWSRRQSEPLASAIAEADVLLCAVSMKGVPSVIEQIKACNLPKTKIILTATKGLDPATKQTPSQMWQAAFPDNPVAVLSGPNLSREIEMGLPATTVVASQDEAAAKVVQDIFSSETFRVYINTDPLGTELGGTLKNIMAIAAGVCDGLNLGTNAKAGLLTRALPEMMRIGTHMGASSETFFGLSGLGDLLATCDGTLSRNYRVGFGLAEGKDLETVLIELQSTAEGVNTTRVLVDMARTHRIPVPIARQVCRLLDNEISPMEAVQALMERELKAEY
ncbi:NAD(P)H-dependent glycerol-3-phosphate dehydrogenase [Spirulina major CS-329]|uniref:NAD(P)H-dependent glycerol-3-phosphate dehydrogenase n=1 Tax=Spirulina TaxID=1154 RepID=UPI0023309D21|nr:MULTISPECIES: NAD(P)H-dependent glycerol-3-phosphate dehydrogenase [Spirulina]MDB9495144.1 NAD(P)H-dependent glycerol-3-phosphate dehydrogenase [Spirulina subsalsa CS-330]MDB9501782.1 NAD(P)H-dependent glycerol-3-phosphate dehydrogenase [Spirulina major CS-329]